MINIAVIFRYFDYRFNIIIIFTIILIININDRACLVENRNVFNGR